MKTWKLIALNKGKEQLEELVAWDYEVREMSPYHFRVNGRLDIWPSSMRWFDHKTLRKGNYDDLLKFVKTHLPMQ